MSSRVAGLPWASPPDFAQRLQMKSFDSRAYSINDFVEWDKNQWLELNPRFQRLSVWSDKAKSYLIDTILRGKPIPKIFIRQKINISTKTSIREDTDRGVGALRKTLRDLFIIFFIGSGIDCSPIFFVSNASSIKVFCFRYFITS